MYLYILMLKINNNNVLDRLAMLLIVNLILLTVCTFLVTGEAPDCGVKNQFRGYCFSFEYCNSYMCGSEKCGYFPKNSVLLKIQGTRIIPQCAITRSTTLKTVSGINSNIHVLASGSFANLPNLKSILLPFNFIRELHHGIFYDVNVELIDLSWNKIIYISEGAFNGVTGLKYLNLSKNELSTLPVRYLPNSLVDINLSNNFLEEIALYGAKQPDLASVDMSYNYLEHVALSFDNVLNKLDLSHNRLNNIDFYDINDVENLKIPSNMFSEAPQFFAYSRIRRVAIHPNPWKCDQLQRLWSHLQNNNIEEEKPNNTESQPLCAPKTYLVSSRYGDNGLECEDDTHCADNLLCRAHRCLDPCGTACESSNICHVRNHEIECLCPGKGKKNPQELFSKCYDVECFSNNDCYADKYCNGNKTCQTLTFLEPAGGFPVEDASTISTGGSGYGGQNPYPSSSYGAPGDGSAGASSYGGQSPSSLSGGGISAGGYSGGYGGQYSRPDSSYGFPSGGSASSSYSGQGYSSQYYPQNYPVPEPSGGSVPHSRPISVPRQPIGEPWWFKDIPKLTPTNTIRRKSEV